MLNLGLCVEIVILGLYNDFNRGKRMRKFLKIIFSLIKILLVVLLLAVIVFISVSYIHIKKTNYDDKYLTSINNEKTITLNDCYYDSKEKSIFFNVSDELISSYIKVETFNRLIRKYDLEVVNYGFDIDVDKKEVYLYLKVLYKDFLPLDSYVLFNYQIKGDVVSLDVAEIKVEDVITITLEKLQELEVKTSYKFKYPKVEISQMITIDINYLSVDNYKEDTLIFKYSLYDYIYNHYQKVCEKTDDSYFIYQTISKYGLDNFVNSNYAYVILELEDHGLEIRK